MLCDNCSKLANIPANKKCVRCQGNLITKLNVLCENCSNTHQQCAICLKKIIPPNMRANRRGCNCGKSKK
jgi:hypothetical protein